MAQGFPILLPNRLFDTNGVIGAGWQITMTNAGLGTLVNTYSDSGLTSLNTNPIVADASGYYRAFVAQGVIVDVAVANNLGVSQYTFLGIEPMITGAGGGSVTAVPTGGIIAFGAAAAPTGFVLCDGSLINRTTFAALFAVIGTTYGAGDGSTTFGVPDMRGRFPFGLASSGTGNTLGGTFGTIDHLHTGPSHTHTVVSPRAGWGFVATVANAVTGYLLTADNGGGGVDVPTGDQTLTTSASGTGNTSTANPPGLVFTFIIKT